MGEQRPEIESVKAWAAKAVPGTNPLLLGNGTAIVRVCEYALKLEEELRQLRELAGYVRALVAGEDAMPEVKWALEQVEVGQVEHEESKKESSRQGEDHSPADESE